MSDETYISSAEAAAIESEDTYFGWHQDCSGGRKFFSDGFSRGWNHRQPEINALTARIAELEGVAK